MADPKTFKEWNRECDEWYGDAVRNYPHVPAAFMAKGIALARVELGIGAKVSPPMRQALVRITNSATHDEAVRLATAALLGSDET